MLTVLRTKWTEQYRFAKFIYFIVQGEEWKLLLAKLVVVCEEHVLMALVKVTYVAS